MVFKNINWKSKHILSFDFKKTIERSRHAKVREIIKKLDLNNGFIRIVESGIVSNSKITKLWDGCFRFPNLSN